MKDGFTFTLTPEESRQLGLGAYPRGHECVFLVKAVVTKNENATATLQAVEIEKVGTDEPPALVGTSPMYKAGMGHTTDKNGVQFTRPTIEPYVS